MRDYEFITESIRYSVEPGSAFNERSLQQIAALIAQGGEVSAETVMGNLVRAPLIGVAFDGERAVGAIVLKQPNTVYRAKVFQAAGVPRLEPKFQLEVGYVYVLPDQRSTGVSVNLMRTVNRQLPPNVFATSREQNTTINKILQFAGFRASGEPYPSSRGNYRLILWTR
jgi:hypothetical protein